MNDQQSHYISGVWRVAKIIFPIPLKIIPVITCHRMPLTFATFFKIYGTELL
jgi:hypothetical protein